MNLDKHAISLKIDVDTYRGIKEGTPVLLDILSQYNIKATFFLSFGPDNAGKAIWNIFKSKHFLAKMVRTRAPNLYGIKTMFYGTFLPSPMIASAFPQIVKSIINDGHEIGVHAWDHRLWQDNLDNLSEEIIRKEFEKSFNSFREILGNLPKSTAAPAWKCNQLNLRIQDSLNLDYSSDTRYGSPFYPRIDGEVFNTLQIPTNQPCIEELPEFSEVNGINLVEHQLSYLRKDSLNVVPVHAEVEGGRYKETFNKFLAKAISKGYEFYPLTIIKKVFYNNAPITDITYSKIPGRGGLVAVSSTNK